MEEFLKKSKANLSQIESYDSVCVILGNESCDLDSVACALAFAYFLDHEKKSPCVHLPVLNIAKEDYCLKTEVVYFLNRFNITSDHLIFRDDICLNALKESGKLKLVLVDHNVLPNSDSNLDSSIVQIVDHHKQEHLLSEKVEMLIEPVGSCSTLVASLIFESAAEILDIVSASLLLGAIIVDCANFSPTAKRATAKDEKIFIKLMQHVPNISKDFLYNELQCAKEDVGHLKFEQLCRKDRKVIEVGGIKLAICGYPFLCSTLLVKYPDVTTKLQDICSVSGYQGAVLMGISINPETDEVERDLFIYSHLAWLLTRLRRDLDKVEPSLDLHAVTSNAEYVYYNQGNITASRKAILPMLKVILSKPETSNNVFSQHGDGRTSVSNVQDESPEDGSSASNSGIDTPTNSCVDDDEEDRRSSAVAKLPAFNSESAFANIESTKFVLFRRPDDEFHPGERDPLTPENSFAESHFDQSYKKFVLNHMDSDAIERKLRQENFFRAADE